MSKLDPRPSSVEASFTWEDLNRKLQSTFSGKSTNPALIIDSRDYLIPKDEIIAEAEKQGYKVSELNTNSHMLSFK